MGYIVQALDVVSPWIKEAPPIWMRPQRRENDHSVSLKVANKIRKLVARDLLRPGLGLDNPQAISKIKGPIYPPIPTKRLLAPWVGCPRDQLSLFLTWLIYPLHSSWIIFSLR